VYVYIAEQNAALKGAHSLAIVEISSRTHRSFAIQKLNIKDKRKVPVERLYPHQ
jgi:hypothetical protein